MSIQEIKSNDRNPNDTDGTGILPSVNCSNAKSILELIYNCVRDNIPHRPIRLLDIGTGLGWFLKANQDDERFVLHGCEGNKSLCDKALCSIIYHNIIEKPIELNLDITTSFEVAEHVKEQDQDKFWSNIKSMSPYHFCSIHCRGPQTDEHRFIRDENYWQEYFNKIGAKYIYVYQKPSQYPSDWPFHKETNIPWECSFICLIRW